MDSDWDLLQYLGVKTKWETVNEVCEWQEETARLLPGTLRFAIYSAPLDNPKAPAEDYQFAGTLSPHESNYDNMLSEIGWVCILKPFQRTHVNTHACALLMHYILDSEAEGGLGLRRLQWKANSLNKPSHKAAMRLGFKEEGVLRALVVLPKGTEGVAGEFEAEEVLMVAGRPGRNEGRQQRDTWMASVTWKEWEDGVREHVDRLVAGIGK